MRYNTFVGIDGGAYAPANSTPLSPNILTIPKANSLYLNEHGDKMEGVLDMNNNKITNVAEPIESKDASTKSYVDNAIKDQQQSINEQFLDNKGLIRSEKLLPVTTFQYFYILKIGDSNATCKVTKIRIPLLFDQWKNLDGTPKYTKLTKEMIHIQIAPFLNTVKYNDEIYMIIKSFEITSDGLDVRILSCRINSASGWGLHLQAHLTLTICFDGILILNST